MRTAISLPANAPGRRWRILVGYNLPLALWTALALGGAALESVARWRCPVHAVVGWCPGCGLTSAYHRFLRGEALPDVWLGIVLAGFAANAIRSILKAQNSPAATPRHDKTGPRGGIVAAPKSPGYG